MLKSRPARSLEANGTNRQLKLLVVVLALSNVILGILSVTLLQKLNRDYSVLLDHSVSTMAQIRALGRESGVTFRALIAGLVNDDPLVVAASVERAQHALAREKMLRTAVYASAILKENPALLAELRQSEDAYEQSSAELIARITPNATAEEERGRINHLQQVVDRYSTVVAKSLDFVQCHSQEVNGSYSAGVRLRSEIMLGLASWPLLVAGLIIILTGVIVATLLLFIKQADSGDEP
jgi:hypothetical protein